MRDPVEQFRDALHRRNIIPPATITIGNMDRADVDDKHGKEDASYIYFADGIPAGGFENHRDGLGWETWKADAGRKLSVAEQEDQRARIEKARHERQVVLERRRAEAAKKATAIWKTATPASADHPYLARKQVRPVSTLREIDIEAVVPILGYHPKSDGAPLAGRLLLVPVKVGDVFTSLEFIDEVGRKSALAGGTKAGGYWAAQPLPEGDGAGIMLLIGEGVATVLSAMEASGHPVIAALSSGNLPAIAKTMRARYLEAELVILADLVKTSEKADHRATDAALAVGALLAVPDFGADTPGATDFNDMAAARGLDAVRHTIAAAAPVGDEAQPRNERESSIDADEDDEVGVGVTPDCGVTGVTSVQANDDAGFGATPDSDQGVTQVTADAAVPDESHRPAFLVFDDWQEHEGRKYPPGVWHFGIKAVKEGTPALTDTRICSPLHVDAVTFDGQANNFGRLLRFKNTIGHWREWAMPMELLRAGGDELRGELLSMGVEIDPSAKTLLANYLQGTPPKRRMRCALQVGWCDGSYVLPDTVIGPGASGVIFQSGERGHEEHTRAGTLVGWQEGIAAPAVGNPLLVLALSASFAGPLLALCNAEGGGIHLVGDSSTGKTTLIEAACATWGGPNFRRSWRATANGMEGAAALFNDCLLALDEISECDPREVGAIVYALGNGRGKQRAGRSGNARGVTRWRCVVLSSGERTIATAMQEGGYRAKAGQGVRLLDIPAARTYGAWDDLHGAASGSTFSDAIKRAAATHYGHAGRAFLEKLTRDDRDLGARLKRMNALPEFAADGGEGQDKRAAGRFALFALAGEVATEYGVTGWPEGTAINAASEGFRAWRGVRGHGNDERRQILDRVNSFIERHGDARFSAADDAESQIRERAGWWRDTDEGRTYLFTADGMREAVKGIDFKRALDGLQEAGALPAPEADGKRSKSQRFGGRLERVYPINAEKVGAGYGA